MSTMKILAPPDDVYLALHKEIYAGKIFEGMHVCSNTHFLANISPAGTRENGDDTGRAH